MEVVEEVCENCFGILSFRDRIQVEMFALCFLWAPPFSALSLILVKCFSRCGGLRFLQMDRQSLFSTARPRCLPSLFFCSRIVLSSSSVTVISLVSIILCVFAVPKSRGAITTQFSNLSTSLRPLFAKSPLASSHANSLQVSTRGQQVPPYGPS